MNSCEILKIIIFNHKHKSPSILWPYSHAQTLSDTLFKPDRDASVRDIVKIRKWVFKKTRNLIAVNLFD